MFTFKFKMFCPCVISNSFFFGGLVSYKFAVIKGCKCNFVSIFDN